LSANDRALGQEDEYCENQAGAVYKKLGHKRLRALEIIKYSLNIFSKQLNFADNNSFISQIKRK